MFHPDQNWLVASRPTLPGHHWAVWMSVDWTVSVWTAFEMCIFSYFDADGDWPLMCAFVGDADVVVGEAGPIPWKKWEDVGFVCGAMELATNSWLPFTDGAKVPRLGLGNEWRDQVIGFIGSSKDLLIMNQIG